MRNLARDTPRTGGDAEMKLKGLALPGHLLEHHSSNGGFLDPGDHPANAGHGLHLEVAGKWGIVGGHCRVALRIGQNPRQERVVGAGGEMHASIVLPIFIFVEIKFQPKQNPPTGEVVAGLAAIGNGE